MTIITKAKRFAVVAHGDQKRKYTKQPYVVHPFAVGKLLATVTDDEEIIAAGILHDVVEDTYATGTDIKIFFGDRVQKLVLEVTDVSKPSDGNREIRKELDRQHIASSSPDGKTIKLADLIDNTYSIVEFDPDFAKVYMREKNKLLDILTEGNPELLKIAQDHVMNYFIAGKV